MGRPDQGKLGPDRPVGSIHLTDQEQAEGLYQDAVRGVDSDGV